MMDWEDSGGEDSGSEDAFGLRPRQHSINAGAKGPMHGLHIALSEGWLIPRGRDMCSFAHDRYRAAAAALAADLPDGGIMRMSFRVRICAPTAYQFYLPSIALDRPYVHEWP
jgi:hypothetical protein